MRKWWSGALLFVTISACTPQAAPPSPPTEALTPTSDVTVGTSPPDPRQPVTSSPLPDPQSTSVLSPSTTPIKTPADVESSDPPDDLYTLTVADAVLPADRHSAIAALELTESALVLNDRINQDPTDTSLDLGLPDLYYGFSLDQKIQGVRAARELGRRQEGWTSGDLTAVEFIGETTRIEGCLSSEHLTVTDRSGKPIEPTFSTIHVMAGVTAYDVGLRIGHIEFSAPTGTACEE